MQKPLGRTVLHMEALMCCALWCTVNRPDQAVCADAERFLEFLSEERILTLAMLADAGDEVMQIVRYLDTEDHDISEVPAHLDGFLHRMDNLFIKRKALDFGYCKFASEWLQRKRRSFFLRKEPRNLGGSRIGQGVLDRCFGRMQTYVTLAESVIRAEFPDFELLHSFAIFNLTSKGKARAEDSQYTMFFKSCVNRLAKAFVVDVAQLEAEFEDQVFSRLIFHSRSLQ